MRKSANYAAAIIALLVAAAPAAMAQDAVEAIYLSYHRAIRLVALCDDRKFDQAEHSAMARVIDERVERGIDGGRRLMLIEQAKTEARELMDRKGCDSAEGIEVRALFERDLATALE